jgi:MFS family permease
LYPLALSIAGDQFRGQQLMAANAAVAMCYGFGSLAGPILGGASMTLAGPNSLMWLIALAALVCIPTMFVRGSAIRRVTKPKVLWVRKGRCSLAPAFHSVCGMIIHPLRKYGVHHRRSTDAVS